MVLITCSPNRPFTFYFSLELRGDLVGHSSMKIITPPSSMFRNQPQHSQRFLVPWTKWRTSKITAWGEKIAAFFPRAGVRLRCCAVFLREKPSNHQASLSTLKSRNEPSRPISPQLTVLYIDETPWTSGFFHKKAVHHLEARAILKVFFLGIAY